MSETVEKQLQALLAKMASMEKEVSTLRAAPQRQAPQAPTFNPQQFISALVTDPIGTLQRAGASPEQINYVTQVHFAHALGDAAPPQMKMLAQMGPQVVATSQLASQIQGISQRLESYETTSAKKSTRESFSAIAKDRKQYPHLAAAYEAEPSLFDAELDGHKGSAAELAEALEARHKRLASVYAPKPPPASDESSGIDIGQSSEAELAKSESQETTAPSQRQSVGIDPTPPPLPKNKTGVWSSEDHDRTRDEILRKYK